MNKSGRCTELTALQKKSAIQKEVTVPETQWYQLQNIPLSNVTMYLYLRNSSSLAF